LAPSHAVSISMSYQTTSTSLSTPPLHFRFLHFSSLKSPDILLTLTNMDIMETPYTLLLRKQQTIPKTLLKPAWHHKLTTAPALVLLSTTLLHLLVHKYYTTTILSAYNIHLRGFRHRLARNCLLGAHMASGLIEVFRWHTKAAVDGKEPLADRLDVLLCMLQSVTNLALVKSMGRGVPSLTRECCFSVSVFRIDLVPHLFKSSARIEYSWSVLTITLVRTRPCIPSHGSPPPLRHFTRLLSIILSMA
jgi:hypothetical protein